MSCRSHQKVNEREDKTWEFLFHIMMTSWSILRQANIRNPDVNRHLVPMGKENPSKITSQFKKHILADFRKTSRRCSMEKLTKKHFFFPPQQSSGMSPKPVAHLLSQTVKEWSWDPLPTYTHIFGDTLKRAWSTFIQEVHLETNSYGCRYAPKETRNIFSTAEMTVWLYPQNLNLHLKSFSES